MEAPRRPPRIVARGVIRGEQRLEIENLAEVRRLVGERLFTQFVRCFVGVDRLTALEHLFLDALEEPRSSTVEGLRNLNLLGFLLASTMYEVGDALQLLCQAQVIKKMSNPKLWDPLNEIRGQWNNAKIAGEVRNQLGHHLGHPDIYEKGLAIQQADPNAVFILHQTSGDLRLDGRYLDPWNSVLLGLNIQETDFEALLQRLKKAHTNIAEHLDDVFFDVVRTAGIATEDERVAAPPQSAAANPMTEEQLVGAVSQLLAPVAGETRTARAEEALAALERVLGLSIVELARLARERKTAAE